MNISKVAAIVSCALVFEAGADQEFFCDAVNGNDDWDGTSATYVSGTVGPKKTIGAAVNLADGTPTVITALPGVYDEGEYYSEINKWLWCREVLKTYIGESVKKWLSSIAKNGEF